MFLVSFGALGAGYSHAGSESSDAVRIWGNANFSTR